MHARALIPSILVLILGCGGGSDSGSPGTPVAARAPSASGNGQSGTVGQALPAPIRIIVTTDGAPQAGTSVTWSAAAGGSVTPTTGVTDASGFASTTWTLGNAPGSQTAQAAVAGATGSPVVFTAMAAAGASATLALAGGNNQVGLTGTALSTPLQVQATDQFGNFVAGVAVTWAVTSGGGSVSPATTVTDAQGLAATTQTLPSSAGSTTVTATSAGLAGSPVTFSNRAVAQGGASSVQVVNNQFLPATLTVSAGTTVTWTWGAGSLGHNIVPQPAPGIPSDPTFTDAPHSYSVTFTSPGTYRYYCGSHGLAGANGIPTGMAGVVVVQ